MHIALYNTLSPPRLSPHEKKVYFFQANNKVAKIITTHDATIEE